MAHRPDLVLRNGTVIDGGGGEPFRADVAVTGTLTPRVSTVSVQPSKARWYSRLAPIMPPPTTTMRAFVFIWLQ